MKKFQILKIWTCIPLEANISFNFIKCTSKCEQMKGKMENAKAKYEWLLSPLSVSWWASWGKVLKAGGFVSSIFLVFATWRKLCSSFTLSSGGEQSFLLYSCTTHAKVEESCINILTNFTVVFATISTKCRTTVYALNLFNKQDCIR